VGEASHSVISVSTVKSVKIGIFVQNLVRRSHNKQVQETVMLVRLTNKTVRVHVRGNDECKTILAQPMA